MLVNNAVYVDGRRTTPATLAETYQACREPGKFAWVTLREPTEEEFVAVAGEFGLDELAVENATKPRQRPKLERYGDWFFVVLNSVRYVKDAKKVEFGEIHAFAEPNLIVTVLYGEDLTLGSIRERMEGEPDRLRRGPVALLYEIMHQVVENYAPVAEALENDMDELEAEVFGGNARVSQRIHELSREVVRFHQATKPLALALEQPAEGTTGLGPEARRHLRHVRDRVLRVTEQIEGFRDLLSSILGVNLAMVGVQQNDQMKRISAWGAILIVPTLVAGIFGMNFDYVPWHDHPYGFWLMVAALVLFAVLLYLGFRRSGWL